MSRHGNEPGEPLESRMLRLEQRLQRSRRSGLKNAVLGVAVGVVMVPTLAAAAPVLKSFTAGQPAVAKDVNDNFTALANEIAKVADGSLLADGAVTAAKLAPSVLPAGTVVAFAGTPDKVPQGWLWCNGALVSRSQFPALFDAIGTAHGGNTTTFNLPDLRGRFVRGVDAGEGRDPDAVDRVAAQVGGNSKDAVGSLQGDAFGRHFHFLPITGNGNRGVWGVNQGDLAGYRGGHERATSEAGASDETRPKNVALHWIIKY